jgi:hypothetical protein
MGLKLLERRRGPSGEKTFRPANSSVKNELVAMVTPPMRWVLTADWRVRWDGDVLVSCLLYAPLVKNVILTL